jgi:hypothetical protein
MFWIRASALLHVGRVHMCVCVCACFMLYVCVTKYKYTQRPYARMHTRPYMHTGHDMNLVGAETGANMAHAQGSAKGRKYLE